MEQYGQMQTEVARPAGRRSRTMLVLTGVVLLVVAGAVWVNLRSSSPGGSGATLSIQPPTTPVQAGSEFTVDILLDAAGYSLTAADLRISFDASMLQAVSIRPGELMPTELATGTVAQGRATITVASGTTPASGGGVIARVTFRALASGSSDVALEEGTQAAAAGQPGNVVGHLVPARITVR